MMSISYSVMLRKTTGERLELARFETSSDAEECAYNERSERRAHRDRSRVYVVTNDPMPTSSDARAWDAWRMRNGISGCHH